MEKDESERWWLILAAQNFALKTAVRFLVDHARASDPQIGDRMEATVEARHTALEHVSDTDREFMEMPDDTCRFSPQCQGNRDDGELSCSSSGPKEDRRYHQTYGRSAGCCSIAGVGRGQPTSC